MKLILLGKILKPHALKGVVTCYLENIESSSLKPGKKIYIDSELFEVESINFSNAKKTMMKLHGLDSINDLDKILGKEIFINREDIDCDEDEVLLNDLIDLNVVSNGISHGRVESFYSNGAQEILVVKGEQTIEIPVIDQFITEIDFENSVIKVNLPEYL